MVCVCACVCVFAAVCVCVWVSDSMCNMLPLTKLSRGGKLANVAADPGSRPSHQPLDSVKKKKKKRSLGPPCCLRKNAQ